MLFDAASARRRHTFDHLERDAQTGTRGAMRGALRHYKERRAARKTATRAANMICYMVRADAAAASSATPPSIRPPFAARRRVSLPFRRRLFQRIGAAFMFSSCHYFRRQRFDALIRACADAAFR